MLRVKHEKHLRRRSIDEAKSTGKEFRTEVLQQRVLVRAGSGVPLEIETEGPVHSDTVEEMENIVDPARAERRLINRAFWQRFIDEMDFIIRTSHPLGTVVTTGCGLAFLHPLAG